MASKFMRIKRIVIPLITLVILVSQISGCAIMNRDDAAGILADNDEVVVEYAEPDENVGTEGIAGQIDTSVPEDTSEDLEDAEIGVVDNIGTLDEGTGPEQAEQPGEVGETEAPEVEAPEVEAPVEAEPTYSFTSVNETVYATTTVNIREGFSADTDKVGSLGRGQSVKRVGIGTGDAEGWSQVEFNGQTAYISSEYLSLTKPAAPSSGSNSGSGGQASQSKPSSGSQSSSSGQTQTQQPSSSGTEHSLDDLADAIKESMEQNGEVGSTTGPLTEETIEGIAGSIELVREILGEKDIGHVYESNKLLKIEEQVEKTWEYIAETYANMLAEIKEAVYMPVGIMTGVAPGQQQPGTQYSSQMVSPANSTGTIKQSESSKDGATSSKSIDQVEWDENNAETILAWMASDEDG